MNKYSELPPDNVLEFLSKASSMFGKIKDDQFIQDMLYGAHPLNEIASPIEQMFFIAMHLVCEVNSTQLIVVSEFNDTPDNLLMIRQWKSNDYRVDFALLCHPIDNIVCVELDGHEFHDRSERERRYEKRRDRHLVASGHQVLHFTGSEVVKDAFAVALEAYILATDAECAQHPKEYFADE